MVRAENTGEILAMLEAYEKNLPDTKEQAEREGRLWLRYIGRDDPQMKDLSQTRCVKKAKENRNGHHGDTSDSMEQFHALWPPENVHSVV